MFFRSKGPNKLVIDSHLGAKSIIKGDVSVSRGIQISGSVHGDVVGESAESVLVLAQGGEIHGGVEAGTVYVDGKVFGPVKAAKLVVVRANGCIVGDVHYGKIQMEEGSCITGRLLPIPLPEQAPANSRGRQPAPSRGARPAAPLGQPASA